MAKKSKKKSKHSVAPGFPGMASPMDVSDHPVTSLPSPAGGAYGGAQLMAPGAPILPGEQVNG